MIRKSRSPTTRVLSGSAWETARRAAFNGLGPLSGSCGDSRLRLSCRTKTGSVRPILREGFGFCVPIYFLASPVRLSHHHAGSRVREAGFDGGVRLGARPHALEPVRHVLGGET